MSYATQKILAGITSNFVIAFLSKNPAQPSGWLSLIVSVYDILDSLEISLKIVEGATKLNPPVPIKESITDKHLVGLEDGKSYQTLKRHFSKRGLTPAEYRLKWGLPQDYPIVAPAYAARRSPSQRHLVSAAAVARLSGER